MKKSLKALALGALILPVGLLSACGDQFNFNSGLNIEAAGKYTDSNVADFVAYVQNEKTPVNSEITSCKIVITGEQDGLTQEIKGMLLMGEDENYKMAYKLYTEEENSTTNATVYYDSTLEGNFMYMDINYSRTATSEETALNMNGKYKVQVDLENLFHYIPSSIMTPEGFGYITRTFAVSEMLPVLTDELFGVEKAASESKVYYKITMVQENTESYNYYYLFDNSALQGIYLSYGNVSYSVEQYSGEISFPNFNGYQELTEQLFGMQE